MIPLVIIGGIVLIAFLALKGKATIQAGTSDTGGTVGVDNPIILAQPDDSLSDTADSMNPSPNWQSDITTDRNTWPSGNKIWDICRAVAVAEGYNTNGAAFQLNNPGDLSPGDEHGQPITGAAEWHGGSYIIHFATAAAGWNALYLKVLNIVNGNSKVYGQNWTISQIAGKWAGDSGAWANNVARELGYNDPTQYGFDDYVGAP